MMEVMAEHWCALQDEWLHEKQAQLSQLEETYEKTISSIGEGHRQAVGEQIVSGLCGDLSDWFLPLLLLPISNVENECTSFIYCF